MIESKIYKAAYIKIIKIKLLEKPLSDMISHCKLFIVKIFDSCVFKLLNVMIF